MATWDAAEEISKHALACRSLQNTFTMQSAVAGASLSEPGRTELPVVELHVFDWIWIVIEQ